MRTEKESPGRVEYYSSRSFTTSYSLFVPCSMGASQATRRVLSCTHCVYTVDVVGVDVPDNG